MQASWYKKLEPEVCTISKCGLLLSMMHGLGDEKDF